MSLIIELNASANMFYLLKHLLCLNLVIFILKCNNLIFNEIMVLNASYVCLLYSRFIEDHLSWILEDGPLISEVVLSQYESLSPSNNEPQWAALVVVQWKCRKSTLTFGTPSRGRAYFSLLGMVTLPCVWYFCYSKTSSM
jgi:hypothetical protein